MQGPRKKNEAELEWSAIRKAATARVTFEAAVWRERRLNDVLDKAWKEFSEALSDGTLMSYETDMLGPGSGV